MNKFIMASALLTPEAYRRQSLRADEQRIKDAIERRILTVAGTVNVHAGGRQDGTAFVFWPSLMMEGSMWSYQYEHFAPSYRVVLIDSPGIGKSEPLRRPIDLAESAEVLVQILDALQIERCIFAGNSYGAMLAVVFAAWHPERLIASIAINATASPPTMAETTVTSLLANVLYLNRLMPKWRVRVAQHAFAGDTAEATNPDFVEYLNCVLNEDPKSISFQMKGILLGRPDRHGILKTIKNVPVLVIAGTKIGNFPSTSFVESQMPSLAAHSSCCRRQLI